MYSQEVQARSYEMSKKKEKLAAIRTAMLAGIHIDKCEAESLSRFFKKSSKPKKKSMKASSTRGKIISKK